MISKKTKLIAVFVLSLASLVDHARAQGSDARLAAGEPHAAEQLNVVSKAPITRDKQFPPVGGSLQPGSRRGAAHRNVPALLADA